MADEVGKAVWEGSRQEGVVGRVGWLAGWGVGQGGMAGQSGGRQVGWRAWSGGGQGEGGRQGGWRGMDLQSKECSGVNIVT